MRRWKRLLRKRAWLGSWPEIDWHRLVFPRTPRLI